MAVLVDTNVILDVLLDDPKWSDWSLEALDAHASQRLAINPTIFAELCYRFESVAEVNSTIAEFGFAYLETPKTGLFLASKAFARYKRSGGTRNFVLPDFFIGGHAEARSIPLITRDATRYRTYFPDAEIIAPQ